VNFTIEGEPGVGGVVGDSEIDPDKSTLADPQMRECVQETMYGLEIDPPRDGGTVRVTYPFMFAPISAGSGSGSFNIMGLGSAGIGSSS